MKANSSSKNPILEETFYRHAATQLARDIYLHRLRQLKQLPQERTFIITS